MSIACFSSCPCVKQNANFGSKAMVDCDSSHSTSSSNDDGGDDVISTRSDEGRRSVFNSRPPTVKKKSSGTVSILHVTPPHD